MTDEFIINYFYGKTCLKGKLLKNIPNDILEYLNNRYEDSLSIKETLYRIKHNLNKRPVCVICGKPAIFKDKGFFSNTCSKKCTNKLRLNSIKNYYRINYGVDNCQQVKEINLKTRNTYISRYGKRIYQTCFEKYGKKYFFQTDIFKEKSKKTKLERYGDEHFNNSYLANTTKLLKNNGKYYNIDKYRETCIEKYGTEHWKQSQYGKEIGSKIMSNPLIQEKRNNTLKEHNTFNTSIIENEIKQYLIDNNINFIYQYKSEKYPFMCDFYFPDNDLYVEINGTWTHNDHPYNKDNKDDQLILEKWKSKNTAYYRQAIYTWTDLDVRKRNIAKQNNLNYLEIFSNNFNYCTQEIKKNIK